MDSYEEDPPSTSKEGSTHPTVLCIAGSPRRRGNSDTLLEACMEGVVSGGGRPEILVAADAGLQPCKGCNSCSKTGECVLNDDVRTVHALIDRADALVVATPVYFATVPAVLKIVYDRFQPYWVRIHRLHRAVGRRRPGALLIVRGGGDPHGHDCATRTTRSVFAVLGVDLVEEAVFEGLDSPRDISVREDALTEACSIGRTIVEAAKGP